MATDAEKTDPVEQIEVMDNSGSSHISEYNAEKGVAPQDDSIPNEASDKDVVTLKTWMVIVVRHFSIISFGSWLTSYRSCPPPTASVSG
jgi:hypothetical protein